LSNYNLKEHILHGSSLFPVGVYYKIFEEHAITLCPLHWHKEIEFFCVTKGGFKVQIDEKIRNIYAGEGAIINAASLHSVLPITEEECTFIAITILPDIFFDSKNEIIMNKYIRPMMQNQLIFENFLSPTVSWMMEVLDLMHKTYDYEHNLIFGHELFVKSNILRILGLCLEHGTYLSMPINNNKISLVKLAINYIHNHYKIDFSLGEMAEAVHVSREYLCKIFKEVTGDSTVTFLNRYRVLKSLEQLDISDFKVSDVALESGFHHISYFNKVFLEIMGCSPTEYRKK
jgi:AraC-like DNA-binding protein